MTQPPNQPNFLQRFTRRISGRGTNGATPTMRPGQKTQRLVGVVVTLLVAGILLVSIFLVQSIPPSAGAGAASAAGVVVFVFVLRCRSSGRRRRLPLRSAALASRRHDHRRAARRRV
jgi:hypothetical protein